MEDLSELQNTLNDEYKQRKREELRTPEGIKKAIGDQTGKFLSKLMQSKKYQVVFAIILGYILLSGLWSVFSHLISVNTLVVVLLCIVAVNWNKIKNIKDKLNVFIKRKK